MSGDADVVVAHLDEPGHARAYAFSHDGYFVVEKPWPKRAVSFSVSSPDGPKRYMWKLDERYVQRELASKGKAKTDALAQGFVPLDAQAWPALKRMVTLMLPKTLVTYEQSRAYCAKTHIHSGGPPMGSIESYTKCTELAASDEELGRFVKSERGKFDALLATPLVFAHYDVARSGDHPEWRSCDSAKACVVASGPCGWTDAIAKRARPAYESWAKTRTEQINCDKPDEDEKVRTSCEAGVCRDPDAQPRPAWFACKADRDCEATLVCDEPIAVTNETLSSQGFARWSWFRTVDAWDRCPLSTGKPAPKELRARCAAGRCELAK